MVDESRAVHELVQQTQARLQDGHARRPSSSSACAQLEGELRRLSDEVSTDLLTEVANRRGLAQAFDVERARMAREGGVLCVGLLDIDNFKKLNDTPGPRGRRRGAEVAGAARAEAAAPDRRRRASAARSSWCCCPARRSRRRSRR